MIKKIVLKPRMSALNYEFLAQPTQMEGRNFYCDIKVCHKIPGGGGTWVFLGCVCAARDSKLAPRSRKNFP